MTAGLFVWWKLASRRLVPLGMGIRCLAVFAAISAFGALNGFILLQGEVPRAMAQGGPLSSGAVLSYVGRYEPRQQGWIGGGAERFARAVFQIHFRGEFRVRGKTLGGVA